MPYSFVWSPNSKKQLKKLPKEIVARIVRKILDLELAPHHFIERLTAVSGWKLRVGDYRAILDINEKKKEIHILKIGHRKKIYK